jgi:hypothetical protein
LTSIFTAVVVTKMVFDAWVRKAGRKPLSIGISVPQAAPVAAKGK